MRAEGCCCGRGRPEVWQRRSEHHHGHHGHDHHGDEHHGDEHHGHDHHERAPHREERPHGRQEEKVRTAVSGSRAVACASNCRCRLLLLVLALLLMVGLLLVLMLACGAAQQAKEGSGGRIDRCRATRKEHRAALAQGHGKLVTVTGIYSRAIDVMLMILEPEGRSVVPAQGEKGHVSWMHWVSGSLRGNGAHWQGVARLESLLEIGARLECLLEVVERPMCLLECLLEMVERLACRLANWRGPGWHSGRGRGPDSGQRAESRWQRWWQCQSRPLLHTAAPLRPRYSPRAAPRQGPRWPAILYCCS